MKRFYLIIAIIALFLTSCKSTYENSSNGHSTLTSGYFDEIDASMVDVDVILDNRPTDIDISGPQKIIPYLRTNIKDGKLEIWIDEKCPKSLNSVKNKLKITVHTSTLQSVEAALGSNINIIGTIESEKFESEVTTGGSIIIPTLICNKLDIEASTGSSIKLENVSAKSADIESSTGASVTIMNGTIDYADLDCSTGASINTHSTTITSGQTSSSTGGSVSAHFVR